MKSALAVVTCCYTFPSPSDSGKEPKKDDCFYLIYSLDTSSFLSEMMYEYHYAVHHRVLSASVHRIEFSVRKHWLTATCIAVMTCVSNSLAQM